MLKKILISGIFIVVAGILLFGAANRTLARSAQNGESGSRATSQARGQGANSAATNAVHTGRNTSEQFAPAQAGSGTGNGAGRRGNGNEQSTSATFDWQTVTGTVTQLDDTEMRVTLDDGTMMVVEGRPWSYSLSQGFAAQVGDELTLRGYLENDEFKTGELTQVRTGQTPQLRDQYGSPAWRGQGGN